MVPELEKVLNTIGTSYDRSLKKRYPQPPAPQAPNVSGQEAPGNVPAPENEGPDEDEEAVLKEVVYVSYIMSRPR
ncbi:MAG: hypothetical protein II617_05835 [Firmicutes bacterium]|nr:hypothetical protein [Bacillota bacterium]